MEFKDTDLIGKTIKNFSKEHSVTIEFTDGTVIEISPDIDHSSPKIEVEQLDGSDLEYYFRRGY